MGRTAPARPDDDDGLRLSPGPQACPAGPEKKGGRDLRRSRPCRQSGRPSSTPWPDPHSADVRTARRRSTISLKPICQSSASAILLGGLIVWFWDLTGGRQQSSHQAPVPQSAPPTVMQAVPVPPVREGETPADVLKPGGQNVGELGGNSGIRILPGGEEEARKLFERLTKGKGRIDITPPTHLGQVIRLPDGSVIGLRPASTTKPATIDTNVPELAVRELKFPEGKSL